MTWYKNSPWRNLVDMHIPDWNADFMTCFSPDDYADCMVAAQVDTALVYAGNCLGICFFPTRVGHMHTGLHGRDIFGQTVEALRARGIRPITYFNIWSRWAFDTHPDWRIRSVDGRDTLHNADGSFSRYGRCCLCAPGYLDYVVRQFEQLCEYDTDGFWIDMTGWHGAVCTCSHCRTRFLAETGRELPETVDFDNPLWVEFQRAREQWLFAFNRTIRETVDRCRPGATCAFQAAFWTSGWRGACTQEYINLSDYLAGDFYGNALSYSRICKLLSNLSPNRPMEFMISRCMDLQDHTTTKSDAELRFSAYAALSHGAAFLFIDAIDPVGTLDRRLYQRMGALKKELKPYLDVWSPAAKLVREVTLCYNFASMYDPALHGKPIEKSPTYLPAGSMGRYAKSLIAAHLSYDMCGPKNLADLDGGVAVLPQQYVLEDGEYAALERFVADGGSLLVIGASGTRDMAGHPADALSALTGVRVTGTAATDVCYFSPTDAALPYFEGMSAAYPLYSKHYAALAQADADTEVLAYLDLPYSHSQEIYRFGSAISNPPAGVTEYPALTRRKYGKGTVMWLAAPIGDTDAPTQQKIFTNLIRSLLPGRTLVETDAPSWMEVMVRRDGARTYITLYKAMEQYYDTAPQTVKLSVRLDGVRLTDVGTGAQVPCEIRDGRVEWSAEGVNDFKMYILE